MMHRLGGPHEDETTGLLGFAEAGDINADVNGDVNDSQEKPYRQNKGLNNMGQNKGQNKCQNITHNNRHSNNNIINNNNGHSNRPERIGINSRASRTYPGYDSSPTTNDSYAIGASINPTDGAAMPISSTNDMYEQHDTDSAGIGALRGDG
jgi:hypothetical protein